ncbi:MAG: hypothetical protein AB8C13_03020 [Phycisphaerales bacterium]
MSEAFEYPHAPDQPINTQRPKALRSCAIAPRVDRSISPCTLSNPTTLIDDPGISQ